MSSELEYYKSHCKVLEMRIDQLNAEIYRLRGFKPLTKEEIDAHNKNIEDKVGQDKNSGN